MAEWPEPVRKPRERKGVVVEVADTDRDWYRQLKREVEAETGRDWTSIELFGAVRRLVSAAGAKAVSKA